MATLGLFENGLLNGTSFGVDGSRLTTDLPPSARFLRRGSQPAAFQSYRRDSLSREPTPSSRRSSIAPRQPMHGLKKDYLPREQPIQNYRRSSFASDQLQNYRRGSFTSEPVELVKPEVTGRRGSDADDINWIAKYQKSDHHTDRLVNTKLEYEKAIGRSFSPQPNEKITPVSTPLIAGTTNTSKLPPVNPYRYEGTNKLTVFLQPSLTKKSDEIERVISHQTSPTHPSSNSGDKFASSSYHTYSSTIHPSVPQTGSISSRPDYRSAFQRQSSSDGTSLPRSSLILSRRRSVDYNLSKTDRPSDLPGRLERGFSPLTSRSASDYRSQISSKYMTEPSQTPSRRPRFHRAPSLPPSLQSNTSPLYGSSATLDSSTFSSSGITRSSAINGSASDLANRRSSLANASDLSASRYRRSLDFGATKNSSSVDSKSQFLSPLGLNTPRNLLDESVSPPLSSLSSLSPLSSLPPSSPSPTFSLPPPSERIFGARSTHSSMRRNRRPVIDG